jgi:hypothetical protein
MAVRNGSSVVADSRSVLLRIVRRSRMWRKPRENVSVVAAVVVAAEAVEANPFPIRTLLRSSRGHRASQDHRVHRRPRVPIRRMAARRAPKAMVRDGGDVSVGVVGAVVGRKADRRQRRRRNVGRTLSPTMRCEATHRTKSCRRAASSDWRVRPSCGST